MSKFLFWLLRPTWVVFTTADRPQTEELGLKIWGVVFSMYKGKVLAYGRNQIGSYRPLEKREFGESLHPPTVPSGLHHVAEDIYHSYEDNRYYIFLCIRRSDAGSFSPMAGTPLFPARGRVNYLTFASFTEAKNYATMLAKNVGPSPAVLFEFLTPEEYQNARAG